MTAAHGPYNVYGLRLRSAWELPYPQGRAPWLAEMSLRQRPAPVFARALRGVTLPETSAAWVTAPVADGATYLRWSRLFEFIIPPDGRSVLCRPIHARAIQAFHTHLGPSLSFALLNIGIEPLHSTTIVVDGEAVSLMGDCGYGKSSLGASFVKAGYPLLTDDLLVLERKGRRFTAYPGAPRVKLFPEIAKTVFGPRVSGLRLKHLTPKLIIPLEEPRAQRTPVPLKAIYVMTPPGASNPTRVTIRRLAQRRAFVELVRNTFNMAVDRPERLERQFAMATALAASVPVKVLSYPRRLDMLSAAREAILADLGR